MSADTPFPSESRRCAYCDEPLEPNGIWQHVGGSQWAHYPACPPSSEPAAPSVPSTEELRDALAFAMHGKLADPDYSEACYTAARGLRWLRDNLVSLREAQAERDAWRAYAEHAVGCRLCGEWLDCPEGGPLRAAVETLIGRTL